MKKHEDDKDSDDKIVDNITILEPGHGESLGTSFTVSGTVAGAPNTVNIIVKCGTSIVATSGPVSVISGYWSYTFSNIAPCSNLTIAVFYSSDANAVKVTGLTVTESQNIMIIASNQQYSTVKFTVKTTGISNCLFSIMHHRGSAYTLIQSEVRTGSNSHSIDVPSFPSGSLIRLICAVIENGKDDEISKRTVVYRVF